MGEVLRGEREREALIAGLASTPDRLAARLARATDALDVAPPGEWSARTVAAHLRDDEYMVMRPRLERMVVEDEPVLAPFDEERWAAARSRERDDVSELIEDFRVQRAASVNLLVMLTASDWERLGRQPEIGRFDVRWWVEHWLEHDETHLAQIGALLRG